MTSIGRICIYVYISSNTRIYSIFPEGFIQACVSDCFTDATPGGGSSKNIHIYIYITLLQGGVEQKKKTTPCEKKMRRMWPMGTRSMPMPS